MNPDDKQLALDLIAEAISNGARQRKACEVLEIDERTIRRWREQLSKTHDLTDLRKQSAQSRTPANQLTEQEKQRIIDVCNQPQWHSLPPSQIVPRLADQGVYIASESSFYRVLHEVDQVNRRGKAQSPKTVSKPKGFQATGPNQVWSWDITFLASVILGCFYRLYLIEDIFSRKIVGWEIHETESAEHASNLIRKTCLAEGIYEGGLVLHSDNGSPMKGATMLATLQKLGVVPSFSRPSVSDDNPYSESLFRTMKYTPSYPTKPFENIEAARQWVSHFVEWYNEIHLHSGIGFVTPGQKHRGDDHAIMQKRQSVYQQAKENNPARWSGNIRNWTPVESVWLNPPKEITQQDQSMDIAA
jgi:putative transposase